MDVDNDPIDPNLLLQFTCLNTTDRDDLIKQFKELIAEVNDETAEFFLEMSNWNLQNAICAFLDYRSPRNEFSVGVLESPRGIDDLTPNKNFIAAYTLRNTGKETWPRGSFLKCCAGNFPCAEKFSLHALEPDRVAYVSLWLTAPSEPGNYYLSLRPTTPWNTSFGSTLHLSFQVHAKLEEKEEQRLSDELAAGMSLIDIVDCPGMEQELGAECIGAIANPPLGSSTDMDQRNMTDYNQSDSRNTS